ncbi:DNA polymerase IV [Coxiella burnetii]|uniref:DNA polymerase IV n=1 Tax=Coxiella burnetii TaxID=777 RepID=UPI002231FD1D|nr:DNA polymerase IV [Coxiella burnetii]
MFTALFVLYGKKRLPVRESTSKKLRKIIHVDMDCFYVAIEMRDNPKLREKPVAVGGAAHSRGVICTANYIARGYGVQSAISSSYAKKLCPSLIILPVNMEKYRAIGHQIRGLFQEYTHLVEPLSLDEAYLDVSDCKIHQGSATRIAQEIREQIVKRHSLTASAGVASNKLLAKVASAWNKPNGIKVILPSKADDFVKTLPIEKIHGVGKITAQKMKAMNIHTCSDLQALSREALSKSFGSFGVTLYELCRGIDPRSVEPNRIRKSVSVEHTFSQDIATLSECEIELANLFNGLKQRLLKHTDRCIRKQFVKIKFNDFKITKAETITQTISLDLFKHLLYQIFERQQKPVRLLGVGVSFSEDPLLELQRTFEW